MPLPKPCAAPVTMQILPATRPTPAGRAWIFFLASSHHFVMSTDIFTHFLSVLCVLRQHRTIWQEHSAKDFASYESYKRAGISVSKKSFRHAGRIFKLSKKFKNTCRLNAKGAFCPLHTSPAALSQTFSARFFDSLNTVVFPPFITARMGQKIGRRPQTQLCGDALSSFSCK